MKYLPIILLFFSCTKEPIGDIVPAENRNINSIIYYAYQHITNQGYVTYPMNQWSATVTFTSSCRYTTIDPLNQDDYSKLFGVRKSPLYQYRNGAYLAWCYVPQIIIGNDTLIDKIRIAWYLHNNNGGFEPMPLSQTIYVNLNEPVYLYLRNYNSYFVYNLNGQAIYINKQEHEIANFSGGYRLSPHSGGDETQDHNMLVSITN